LAQEAETRPFGIRLRTIEQSIYIMVCVAILVAILTVVSVANTQRRTVNDCSCKKQWDMPGVGKCTEYCCNPDQDGLGSWCMVETSSISCEDNDWGYCSDSGGARPAAPTGCRDVSAWHDVDGDDCTSYLANEWCDANGKAGRGWHEEWGNLLEFMANGFSSVRACCGCGGGIRGGNFPGIRTTGSERFTYIGCKCRSMCFPDVAGDWCTVEDEDCQEDDWGYCRAAGGGEVEASTSSRHGHCTDKQGWVDLDGSDCQEYARDAYCTDVGGYGLGWNEDWGLFSDYAFDGRGADVHCCACGGGTKDSTHQFVQSVREPDERKVRTTWTGCECMETWNYQGSRCDDYCCNFDNDQNGAWCQVKDRECEGVQWGYCATSGLGMVIHPQQDAVHCIDQPFFKDPDGDGCHVYLVSAWCTPTGTAGPGWHSEWGNMSAGGATKACCSCGGGFRRKGDDEESTVLESLQEAMSEEDEYMWKVVAGPCRMDDDGCISSGNYPKAYGPFENCQIKVDEPAAVPIRVVDFDTEVEFDVLKLNGKMWSGTRGPDGIIPESTIFWGTDGREQGPGWKMCPRSATQRKPWLRVIRILGITSLVLMCTCCVVNVGLYIHMRRNRPLGDVHETRPIAIGKEEEEDPELPPSP